ncbi:MAG: glycosyltransferase family 4 protein [Phycisphaerales bacterium]|nr:MAG: glycosyltransferase family 4 protein [Phycisphaerales bacterium]
MRLGLYHGPLYRGDAGYESYGPYVRYIAEFARNFDEVVVFAPVTTRPTDYRGCRIEADNVRIAELPDFSTHVQASRHVWSIYRTFHREIDSLDVINCRNTAPYGYLLYYLGRRRGVGFFYCFTSDPWEILEVGPKYQGLYGRFAKLAYGVDFWIQKRIMRRTYSFIMGRQPYERYKHITDRMEPLVSSTLTRSDFAQRTDHTPHKPVRLLYVGYLKHMKGLPYLVDALKVLCDGGDDVELHLVGAGPEEESLRDQVRRLKLGDNVHFNGYVPMGPELNAHYDGADIFVFPSFSEGSPRVVLEALAHSLPVVSTPVGSVSELITDRQSGLIVPLRDAEAIAAAVKEYILDDELRARCARAGFAIAKEHSIECYIQPMVDKAKQLARPRSALS